MPMKSPVRGALLLEGGPTVINCGRDVSSFCSSLFRISKTQLLPLSSFSSFSSSPSSSYSDRGVSSRNGLLVDVGRDCTIHSALPRKRPCETRRYLYIRRFFARCEEIYSIYISRVTGARALLAFRIYYNNYIEISLFARGRNDVDRALRVEIRTRLVRLHNSRKWRARVRNDRASRNESAISRFQEP